MPAISTAFVIESPSTANKPAARLNPTTWLRTANAGLRNRGEPWQAVELEPGTAASRWPPRERRLAWLSHVLILRAFVLRPFFDLSH